MKIILELKGGIGNQLFQFCFAKEIASKYGCEIFVDKKTFFIRPDTHGEFLMDDVCLVDDKIHVVNSNFIRFVFKIHNKIVYKFSPNLIFANPDKKNFLKMSKYGIVTSHDTPQIIDNINEIKIKNPFFTTVDGYYQWPQIIGNSIDWVKENIKFYPSNDENTDKYSSQIKSCTAVAVHIRRGDYLNTPYLLVCDYAYYKRAIDKMKEAVPDAKLFIFSDDLEWVRENYKFDGVYVDIHGKSMDEIMLMSLCKHFVISNSTFSWWGQALSKNPNKKVIAPSKWVTSGANSELYMDYFDVIEV